MKILTIKVEEEVARLENPVFPLYPLVKRINDEFDSRKSSSLEIDLVFEYGEATWDSCAPLWVGDESIGPTETHLSINRRLPIDVLKEDLAMSYGQVSHSYGGDLPKNIIRLSLANPRIS